MKAINTSTFNFPNVIINDFLYVDKTAVIAKLVQPKIGEYFLFFEFKLNKTARKAVGQIMDRRYVEKFMGSGLPIVCVGANFNAKKSQLDSCKELETNH